MRKILIFVLVTGSAVLLAAENLKVERRKPLTANVGVVSVGLDTYWKQCPGLLEDMMKKEDVFIGKLNAHSVKVSRFGMSDNPQKASSMIPAMKAADLDILFIDMVTYATSSTFAPFVRELKCPIVLVALQPDSRLDYEKATVYKQLYNDDFCSVPEFTGVAVRYGKEVADVIIGKLNGDARADEEIRQWCAVAHVLHDLRRARIGLMGHVLEAMYDMQVDPTAVSRTFGCHVALCEPDEILPFYRAPVSAEVNAMKKRILEFFDTPDPVSDPWTEKLTERDLDVAAKAAVALEKFIEKRNLDGFAYYYEGESGSMTRELVTNFIVGNSLLTAAGFPMCGEFDLKNCVAMMIFDRLDIGGSFAEFHPNRLRARHGSCWPRRASPPEHRREASCPPFAQEVSRQAGQRRGRRVQHQGRADYHAFHRTQGRRLVQVHRRGRRVACRSYPGYRQHQYARQISAGCAHVPQELVA